MLSFSEIKKPMEEHIKKMMEENDYLYTVSVDKDQLWETYLNAIPPQHNKIYVTRREHDCSACRHFVKQFGDVVAINNGKVTTVWDFKTENDVCFYLDIKQYDTISDIQYKIYITLLIH